MKNERVQTIKEHYVTHDGIQPMTKEMVKESEHMYGRSLHSEKYRRAALNVSTMIMQKTMAKHPAWPLNQVIAETIKGMNPEIPPKLLLEIMAELVNHWEEKTTAEAVAA